MEDFNNEIVARNGQFVFTRRELEEFFDTVANEENWKMPINKIVRLKGSREILGTYEAVRFFAGCTPEFHFTMTRDGLQEEGPMFRVEAEGYYMAVGA